MSHWAAHVRSRRRIVLVATVCGAVLVVYLVRLLSMGHTEVVRSDYLSAQTGGVIVADGQGSQLYEDVVQAPVYTRLVAGDHTGDLPFNHAPLTAVMDAPISGLDPVSGHRLWGLFQFLLVTIACGIAAGAAPWPKRTPRLLPVTATLVALVGAGTLPMLTAGQDLGTISLGLALAYAAWQRGRLGIGAAALVAGAAIAKPHLALGLLAFMAGWRDRRIIAGALIGGLTAAALSVMAVGWAACVAFVETAIRSNGLPQAHLVGFTGLFASWFGESVGANVLAGICSVAVLALAVALGVAVRRDRSRLGPALIAATLLSLLASPHTFVHDLTLLAPMLVVALAEAARRVGWSEWPSRPTRVVLIVWLLMIGTVAVDSDAAPSAALGRLTPLVLMLAAAVAVRTAGRGRLPHADPEPATPSERRATYAL